VHDNVVVLKVDTMSHAAGGPDIKADIAADENQEVCFEDIVWNVKEN